MERVKTTDVTLHDGSSFPAIGYGTFQLRGVEETAAAVEAAIASGYRLIDTAADYGNEEGVGLGVRRSAVPRSDVVVSSKVWPTDLGYEKTMRAFEKTLRRLGLDYLDLYLIHWPCSRELNAAGWRAMEQLHDQGVIRRLGVSNFTIDQLEGLMETATVPPVVNQVEYHPGFFEAELKRYCARRGILLEGWSPLMQGAAFTNPTLDGIAGKHGRSVAQVTLRWSVQSGVVPLPKTRAPQRMRENISIFDFTLDGEDMTAISGLRTDDRLGPDPASYQFCES